MRPPPAGGPGAPPLPRGPPSASSGLSSPSMLGTGGPPPPQSRVTSAPGPPRPAGGPPSGLASQAHTPPPTGPGAGAGAAGPPVARAKTLDPLEALLASGPPTRGPTPTGSAASRKKNVRSRYVSRSSRPIECHSHPAQLISRPCARAFTGRRARAILSGRAYPRSCRLLSKRCCELLLLVVHIAWSLSSAYL
jgi:hypothetical protein